MLTNMLDYLRYALYAVLVVISFSLYQQWDKEHPKTLTQSTQTQASTTSSYIPSVATPTKATDAPATPVNNAIAPAVTHQIIHVKTDVLNVDIDALGGNIVQVTLPKYPESLNSTTPFVLLNDTPDTRYVAQSGLLGTNGPDSSKGQALYTTDQTDYTLGDQKELQVNLHWQNADGLKITKTFTFKPNDYQIGVNYQIDNQSKAAWDGNLYLQLMRKNPPSASSHTGFSTTSTYLGAAISSPQKPFEKVSFKDMSQRNIDQTITGGWAAMVQHYFVSAWVPNTNSVSQYFSRVTDDGLYTIGMIGPKISVNPGQSIDTTAKFYAGPSIAEKLEKVAPGLQLTIDYGWFWFISGIIFWMMQLIHSVIGNWGWSIVLVTVVIKLMFFHLSAKSYRSMSALKTLQPKINALKERFGEDKQKFTQATLELYKKEKVNPMSGCLPILIQIPVFIALYWVLIESVYLRQAPFILWIHDLSVKDPYYVLPVLMALSMLVQQRLSPPPPDPMQAKVMMFMPLVFGFLFYNFPAGLMLYWFVNNSLSVLQQWYIMRSSEAAAAKKKTK